MNKEWQIFESYVARLYSALGYTTTRDVLIRGQQVDLVADKFLPEIGHLRIAIECKHREDASSFVSKDEVAKFANFAELARSRNEITKAIMVTNGRYTRFAREIEKDSSMLNFITIDKLEGQLFNFDESYGNYIDLYKKERIFSSYVPLSGDRSRGLGTQGYTAIDDVQQKVHQWIDHSPMRLIVVLGDFGAGKTTLIERLKYDYALNCMGRSQSIKPIMFYLKEFYQHPDLESLIRRTLNREFLRDIPMSLFWKAARQGRFLFLLDGFDEMASKTDRKRRADLFLEMSRLLTSGSKAVLTCRPSYFVTEEEYREALKQAVEPIQQLIGSAVEYSAKKQLLDGLKKHLKEKFSERPFDRIPESHTTTLRLKAFDNEKIDLFLSRLDSSFIETSAGKYGWMEVRDFLNSVYDLSDLMKRPILLDMIAETVLAGAIDISNHGIKIGPTSLYETYTDMQFDRDWGKGGSRRNLLTKGERRQFSQAIALTMLITGNLEVTYDDIVNIIRRHQVAMAELSRKLESVPIEEIASDIQICTFLSRARDGVFKFTHKSFMEYFVARLVKESAFETRAKAPEATLGMSGELLDIFLPRDVLYFLGGYGFIEADFLSNLRSQYTKIRLTGRSAGSNAFRNICSCVFYTSNHLRYFLLPEAKVSEIGMSKIQLKQCDFSKSHFKDVRITDVRLVATKLNGSMFENCNLQEVLFEKSTGSVEFSTCAIDGVSMVESDMKLVLNETALTGLKVQGGGLDLSGSYHLSRGSFDSVESTIDLHEGKFKGVAFSKCTLIHLGRATTLKQLDYNECSVILEGDLRLVESGFVGGSLIFNTASGMRSELLHCTMDDVDISQKGSPLDGGDDESDVAATMKDVVLRTCKVIVRQAVRFLNCQADRCVIEGGENGSPGIRLDSTELRHCALTLSRGLVEISDCTYRSGEIVAPAQDGVRVVLSGSTFEDVFFDLMPRAEVYSNNLVCASSTFKDSTLLGLPLLPDRPGRQEGFRAQLSDCRGFFIILGQRDKSEEREDRTVDDEISTIRGLPAVYLQSFLKREDVRSALADRLDREYGNSLGEKVRLLVLSPNQE